VREMLLCAGLSERRQLRALPEERRCQRLLPACLCFFACMGCQERSTIGVLRLPKSGCEMLKNERRGRVAPPSSKIGKCFCRSGGGGGAQQDVPLGWRLLWRPPTAHNWFLSTLLWRNRAAATASRDGIALLCRSLLCLRKELEVK
jgi:hypothetical protein